MSELQAALGPIFEENFKLRGDLGASVSVWKDGREIVSLTGGFRDQKRTQPWEAGTMALVYSGTKGPAAACVLRCLWEAGIALGEPVRSVWPEFGQAGKERITFADVLSHRGAVPALDHPPDAFDYRGVIREVQKQAPFWTPGDGHGYHPRTCGYIWDEIVRRVAGMPLGRYWRQFFGEALDLDFWIGLPEQRLADVAPLHAARVPPVEDEFLKAFADPKSITHRAFSSPIGLFSVTGMNSPPARMASFPAFGGIGSAKALAKFYGMLACGGSVEGRSIIAGEAVATMSERLANGFDRVLRIENAFSTGVMLDPIGPDGGKSRLTFGPSFRAFGQPGAGGSIGFADPERGLGFAYVMNQMEPGVLPNRKSTLLIERMYQVLG